MSVNWSAKANENRFVNGVVTDTITPLTTSGAVTINGSSLAASGVVMSNQLNVDLIQEKTTNQGVSIADTLKVDLIEPQTSGREFTEFSNDIEVNGDIYCNSLKKNTTDLTIDLGHSNSSVLSYFEVYTNSAVVDPDSASNSGEIPIGGLVITRINDLCILTFRVEAYATPNTGVGDFTTVPSRFRPTSSWRSRDQSGVNANDEFLYSEINSSGKLRVGKVNFSGTLVDYDNNEILQGSITYSL